jgi:hypothetical protein
MPRNIQGESTRITFSTRYADTIPVHADVPMQELGLRPQRQKATPSCSALDHQETRPDARRSATHHYLSITRHNLQWLTLPTARPHPETHSAAEPSSGNPDRPVTSNLRALLPSLETSTSKPADDSSESNNTRCFRTHARTASKPTESQSLTGRSVRINPCPRAVAESGASFLCQ